MVHKVMLLHKTNPSLAGHSGRRGKICSLCTNFLTLFIQSICIIKDGEQFRGNLSLYVLLSFSNYSQISVVDENSFVKKISVVHFHGFFVC